MFIELKGVEFENKGAELMLYAVLDKIKLYWPEAQIVLSPSSKAPYIKRTELGAWQKLSVRKLYIDLNELTYYIPKALRNWLKKWGILTEADIDMVIDASGFSYSDQWNPSMSIRHLSAEINRNHKHKKPYIFMPQAFGPFSSTSVKKNIAKSFHNAALVNAREQVSHKHLYDIMGESSNLQIYGDFTNAIDGILPSYFKDGHLKACIIPNKNMVNSRNNNKSWIDSYADTILTAIKIYQAKGLTPFFLNHEGKEDLTLINELNAQLSQPLEVYNEDNPLAVKGIIANSRGVLCSRFHGCVSALSNGIPCIGTSWSHKYEKLYSEYSASELLLTPNTASADIEKIIELTLDTDEQLITQHIKEKAQRFKVQTESLWNSVVKASNKYKKA